MSTATITKKSIISNLQQVAGSKKTLTREQYRSSKLRQVASSTVEETFGSFSQALKAAKLVSR